MLPGLAEPAVGSRAETSVGGAEGDWLCAWCLNRVANEQDRFPYNGRDPTMAGTNSSSQTLQEFAFILSHFCRRSAAARPVCQR